MDSHGLIQADAVAYGAFFPVRCDQKDFVVGAQGLIKGQDAWGIVSVIVCQKNSHGCNFGCLSGFCQGIDPEFRFGPSMKPFAFLAKSRFLWLRLKKI
jgi:hypothetical protein